MLLPFFFNLDNNPSSKLTDRKNRELKNTINEGKNIFFPFKILVLSLNYSQIICTNVICPTNMLFKVYPLVEEATDRKKNIFSPLCQSYKSTPNGKLDTFH